MVPRALVVLAALALTASGARADDGAALVWRAEVGCGSAEALAARIAAQLGRPLVPADHVAATVEVVRAPLERDVRAHLDIVTARGRASRDVRGADCAAVVEAVAFVLAAAVEDEGAPPAPGPPPPRPSAPTLGRGLPVVPTPRPAILRGHLRLDGWSDAGTLPEFRLGLGGSLGVSYARARVEVGGALWRAGWTGGDAGSDTDLHELDVRGCGGVWEVWVCGGALAGTFDGAGLVEQRFSALSALVRWTRPFGGHLAVSASVEAVIGIDRPHFGANDLTRSSPVALRLGLGVEGILE
ncbi:MAG: hypothetical protein IPL61_07980 [Myxococcales bacterium]|nr:hypothetical protein [Myxococcales bacterium]